MTTDPTESEKGLLTYVCQNDKSHVKNTYILPELTETDYTLQTDTAKCEEDGKKVYALKETSMGEFKFEVKIDRLNHDYGTWIEDIKPGFN